MEELLLGYDTASTLAADALFGGSGDQQEHGKEKDGKKKGRGQFSIPLFYTGRGIRHSWVVLLDG